MTMQSATQFDVGEFARAYAEWDIHALLDLYADDVELVQIDRDHPPSAPRVRHGKELFRGMFEHCAAAGVKATVENTVAGRAARRRDGHVRVPGRPEGPRQRDLRRRRRPHRPRVPGPGRRREPD